MKTQRNYYKVYNKQREYGRRTKPHQQLSKGEYLKGVSCFIINNRGEILIETRKSNTPLTPGKKDLCSGHVDQEETYTQAMIREYVEELHKGEPKEQEQAKIEAIQNLMPLTELNLNFGTDAEPKNFWIQFYVMKTKMKKVYLQETEVEEIQWLPMEEVFDLIREGNTKFPYDERFEKLFQEIEKSYRKEPIIKDENGERE